MLSEFSKYGFTGSLVPYSGALKAVYLLQVSQHLISIYILVIYFYLELRCHVPSYRL